MVKSYPFRRTDADDLIVVGAYVNRIEWTQIRKGFEQVALYTRTQGKYKTLSCWKLLKSH